MTKWKDIKGYEGLYQIADNGTVYSVPRYNRLGRFIPGKNKSMNLINSGYYVVNLKIDGKQKNHLIHRLVAQAFIPNPENLPEVNHKDGDKTNNHVDNLEWVTISQNKKHAHRTGLLTIHNKRKVKVTNGTTILYFESQFDVSKYFGFTTGWCHQRILRNGNPFKYEKYTVEVL